MGRYFGTDGFRGEAGKTLTVVDAYRIGRFLGYYYGKKQGKKARVVMGKDTRVSSYMLENALVAGLTSSGADVSMLYVTTTPSVSYIARIDDFDCGIMISASHNPYTDNGIKVITGEGEKLQGEVEEEMEAYLDGPDHLPFATGAEIGRATDDTQGRNRYAGYLMTLATRSFKRVKVGLDCANGSAYMLAKGVFDALGADTYVIHNEPNGLNINEGCGSTHIEELQQYVLENHLDVGFAFDGDADRCMAVDETGRVVDGDGILYLCGCYLKERGELNHNTVVTTIMSNLGLYQALENQGISYRQTAVGDKYVYECMSEHGYSLGGEQSGHIIFSKYATTGDGILTALKVMEVMLEKKTPLSILLRDLTIYPQVLQNVSVKDKKGILENPGVQEALKKAEKTLGETGRILLRESGTEPVIRVMAEAPTKEMCQEQVSILAEMIEELGK